MIFADTSTPEGLITLAITTLDNLGVKSVFVAALGAAITISLMAYILRRLTGNAGQGG